MAENILRDSVLKLSDHWLRGAVPFNTLYSRWCLLVLECSQILNLNIFFTSLQQDREQKTVLKELTLFFTFQTIYAYRKLMESKERSALKSFMIVMIGAIMTLPAGAQSSAPRDFPLSLLYIIKSVVAQPRLFLSHTLHIILLRPSERGHTSQTHCHTLPPHPPTPPPQTKTTLYDTVRGWLKHPAAFPLQLTDRLTSFPL